MEEKSGRISVAIKFSEEGGKKFEEATGRLIGKKIGIFFDDRLIMAPSVQAKVTGGNTVIDSQGGQKEAQEMAVMIRSGLLPFAMEVRDVKVY